MTTILIIVLVVLLLGGGGYMVGPGRAVGTGTPYGGISLFGLVLVILVLWFVLFRGGHA